MVRPNKKIKFVAFFFFTNLDKLIYFGFRFENCEVKSRNEIPHQLIQHCIIPRCVFSGIDSLYCTKFIHWLHKIETPYFSSLVYFNNVSKDFMSSVFCLTEAEASRLGRFLFETLSLLKRWRSDKAIYDAECASLKGIIWLEEKVLIIFFFCLF